MRKQPSIEAHTAATLTILSVSPHQEDHSFLEAIIGRFRRTLLKANNIFTARATLLQTDDISVVVCESDLMPGSWTDILKHVQSMPHPPSMVVTSNLADSRLWSVALHLGAWDVLTKPFDRLEVIRSVKSAWNHWHHQIEMAAGAPKVMRAG